MMSKMSELNRELLLDELSNFEQKKSGIPVILEKYLESIAQNGDTMFSWNKLQPLLRRKLEIVMNEFNDLCPTDHLIPLPNVRPFDFEELKQQILTAIDTFCSAPFTVQRICELITNPSKHYKRTDKFMRGIEKNILVVTTIEPKSADGSSTQYSTSSFKNLFSALHSTSNSHSMNSPWITVHNTIDQHLSSPVSPNSLPLSSSSNSPPNPHLAPLQQLDSFTTVFASTPSTPLSVVSDLHNEDHASSLSLMTSSTSGENIIISSTSSETKISETKTYFETNASQHTDTISSNNIDNNKDNSLQIKSSADIVSETKVDSNESVPKENPDESKQTDSKQITIDSEDDKHLSQKTTNDTNNETSDKSINSVEVVTEEDIVVNDTKTNETSSESLVINNDNNTESMKKDNSSVETLESDVLLSAVESKTPVEESIVSQNNQTIENMDNNNELRITTDEEMSQPMDDFCGNSGPITDNIADMTDDPAPDVMDHTLNQSDQSEPMDED